MNLLIHKIGQWPFLPLAALFHRQSYATNPDAITFSAYVKLLCSSTPPIVPLIFTNNILYMQHSWTGSPSFWWPLTFQNLAFQQEFSGLQTAQASVSPPVLQVPFVRYRSNHQSEFAQLASLSHIETHAGPTKIMHHVHMHSAYGILKGQRPESCTTYYSQFWDDRRKQARTEFFILTVAIRVACLRLWSGDWLFCMEVDVSFRFCRKSGLGFCLGRIVV